MVLHALISPSRSPCRSASSPLEGRQLDRPALMAFAVLGFSVPVFVAGYPLAYHFRAPARLAAGAGLRADRDRLQPWLEHLVLPAVTLGLVYSALIARITRASMLEVLPQDYIRTARAKGMAPGRHPFVHALQNAAVPIVTVIGIGIALLIGGAVVTENVFAIPGLGRLTVDAILRRDYPVIQGVVLMFTSFTCWSIWRRPLYTLLDPRIRY